MKKLSVSALLSLGVSFGATAAMAQDCGDVTIASMNWQSAEVLAALDAFILKEGYGCNTSVITGDTVPTITSMVETGAPDLAPEGWVDLVPEVIARGTAEGRLVPGALALSDGAVQGWWIPKYLADANPDLKTIDDVLKRPDLFPDAEDASKGAVHNGPAGWGGTVVTAQLFKAYGAEAAGFKLIDTGSAAGLDGSIARAYENQQGWVGYYWAPTALLGKYEMVKLDHGVEFNAEEWARCNSVAECPDPQKNDWPGDTVQTLMTSGFAERAPADVKAYLDTRSWSNATVNALMAWMTDNQAAGEDGARYFLENNEEIWTPWVTPEAAEKIRSAL
ncbi:glycine betaine ABC transporter substrate-binding protein [Pseudogemmobacter humi]|uniref:Substrate binding domain of ABC-type glycine betaine transport system n=1 Tax=Pseudogemmobacter humi TaxID=2483812 RepID=A0A3P5WYB2_9RHOB|nr:glycine betaine ABC transporter substrate-binding protein [Pseudogemmobacter humi]VDC19934.1 Substrate binding domain of ABC-type glycine betaine transport system [Pseudogemmobacter humi]